MREQDIAQKIHDAAMDLLDNPGIKLDHDDICNLLLSAGAKAGHSANVIRFPKELVLDKLALCPREVLFSDREGRGDTVTATSDAVIWSVPGLKIF